MALTYYWPNTLPQSVERGFSESIGLNVLRTPMDAGPSKIRRRSLRPETMSVTFLFTTAQVAILESFIFDTIKGVYRFGFTHPRKNTVVETRIVPTSDGQYFTATYRAPGYWGISLQLEILP
jgi:hypothetical protein